MNEQQIKNFIKIWREKARSENDHFLKFFLLWICFNAWLEYRSGKYIDAKMINLLANQDMSLSDLVESYELCKNKSTFKTCLNFLVKNSPFEDSRGKKPAITVRNEDDFENIVKVIYRIRCNLFHGGTQAHEEKAKSQIKICADILNEWIATLAVKIGAY